LSTIKRKKEIKNERRKEKRQIVREERKREKE
jgi:hypothetical protein